MRIEFLGTGAADWSEEVNGEFRAFTSTLIDDKLLIDGTMGVKERLGDPGKVKDIIYTHSHRDHYNAEFLAALTPVRAHMHKSWADTVKIKGVEVVPFGTLETFDIPGYKITAMPSNHSTEKPDEQTVHFIIRGDNKTILYATDGGWLRNEEWHTLKGEKLDAAIFDATIGEGYPGDFRIFEHNSIDMVRIMVRTLRGPMLAHTPADERLPAVLKPGARVFLTHMARTLHPSQAALERTLAGEFVPAYDGMAVEI